MSNKPEYSIFDPAEIPCEEISNANALVKEPVVSVTMVTYNHEPYIAQAIEGVLQQKTNFPYELVVGEDCSTDDTRKIVLEYQKKHPNIIRVITSDHNVGASKNNCRIQKACRGKYIAYCDGDDYWHHPRKLQRQADYMESHPECGLVYSDYDKYDVRSNRKVENYNKYRKIEFPLNPTLSDIVQSTGRISSAMLTCTVMVRRSLLNQIVDSDPYLHQSEEFLMGDTQVWAEISHMADAFYIEDSLATHNLLVESVAKSRDFRKRLRFTLSGKTMLLYLCDKYNLPSNIRKDLERKWCYCSLQLAFFERNADLADQVKKRKGSFTWKERLKYVGSKNLMLNYLLRVIAYCRRLFLPRSKDIWF